MILIVRDLKFIHITKTAGTSIEQAGINAGLFGVPESMGGGMNAFLLNRTG